ncbi:23 kDa integral membrane protein-like [Varroa destructor]|uniref:Tetraspanin n=2 Tax=Varroa TaxID=62624 RepID=A0A7M7MDB0_VARDE|nr:23 kDa integral membrane protein-like [Varroa destructor]
MNCYNCYLLYWFFLLSSLIIVIAVAVACGAGAVMFISTKLGQAQIRDELSLINTTAILVLIISCLVVFVILWGFYGVCFGARLVLVSYMILMVLLVMAEVVPIGLLWIFTNKKVLAKVADDLMNGLLATADKQYGNEAGLMCLTVLSVIQSRLRCCGANSIEDYDKFNLQSYKYLCKKGKQEELYLEGCTVAINSWFSHNTTLMGTIAFGSIIFEVMTVVLAGLLIGRIKQEAKIEAFDAMAKPAVKSETAPTRQSIAHPETSPTKSESPSGLRSISRFSSRSISPTTSNAS